MSFELYNRRYTGSKYKLRNWIKEIIKQNCEGNVFCDLFAGTGVITDFMFDYYDAYIINDFLFSNEIIYKAFFVQENYDTDKLKKYLDIFSNIHSDSLDDNYISINYGNKFFSITDAKIIGYIREQIEKEKSKLSEKEYNILLASLLFSLDKVANTVGHYDSFLKNKNINSNFVFELINPKIISNKKITIFRENANNLVKKIQADIVYIDPPYSSRQYSRFYHVLENITTWKKPELYGAAAKPLPENMSNYSRATAINEFSDLIQNLNCNFIITSYNNTYYSKSSSSRNKMSLEDIKNILNRKGNTKIFEKNHPFFNAGKTSFLHEHKEILFITKVGQYND
ncbi:DNA adenine methylase [Spiroplasma sp. SV19]|uniref:DNA adenine methylase n=1 Tax=Spiroplasma sp. SV19 TaxID=2570468 RepID=UPI0024B76191|nr:DNA adenine methylase [Spiroplasma sp. SV19]WHQ37514.1 adenine methyltransferase [Spiroplasma sp. SV19]